MSVDGWLIVSIGVYELIRWGWLYSIDNVLSNYQDVKTVVQHKVIIAYNYKPKLVENYGSNINNHQQKRLAQCSTDLRVQLLAVANATRCCSMIHYRQLNENLARHDHQLSGENTTGQLCTSASKDGTRCWGADAPPTK